MSFGLKMVEQTVFLVFLALMGVGPPILRLSLNKHNRCTFALLAVPVACTCTL